MGNWIGFDGAGNSQPAGNYGVLLNIGAHDNVIGSPDLADRNVIGSWRTAVSQYGPGTDRNVIQNNQLCIKPGGADHVLLHRRGLQLRAQGRAHRRRRRQRAAT